MIKFKTSFQDIVQKKKSYKSNNFFTKCQNTKFYRFFCNNTNFRLTLNNTKFDDDDSSKKIIIFNQAISGDFFTISSGDFFVAYLRFCHFCFFPVWFLQVQAFFKITVAFFRWLAGDFFVIFRRFSGVFFAILQRVSGDFLCDSHVILTSPTTVILQRKEQEEVRQSKHCKGENIVGVTTSVTIISRRRWYPPLTSRILHL